MNAISHLRPAEDVSDSVTDGENKAILCSLEKRGKFRYTVVNSGSVLKKLTVSGLGVRYNHWNTTYNHLKKLSSVPDSNRVITLCRVA
jgi:hypothetical protein